MSCTTRPRTQAARCRRLSGKRRRRRHTRPFPGGLLRWDRPPPSPSVRPCTGRSGTPLGCAHAEESPAGSAGAGSIGAAGTFWCPSFCGRGMSGLMPAPSMRVHDPSGVATHSVALWSAGHSRLRSARVVMALLVAPPTAGLRPFSPGVCAIYPARRRRRPGYHPADEPCRQQHAVAAVDGRHRGRIDRPRRRRTPALRPVAGFYAASNGPGRMSWIIAQSMHRDDRKPPPETVRTALRRLLVRFLEWASRR
jgi:hypothetical protein